MQTDSLKINKRKLIQLLQSEYQLIVDQLVFVPKGEESYGYVAETGSGTRYFVKVHNFVEGYTESNSEQLLQPYRIAHQLKNRMGLAYVVSPLPTKDGALLCEFGEFAVALFEFKEGRAIQASTYQEQDWASVAGLMADLHERTRTFVLPDMPQETFTISFRQWLLDVIAAAQTNQATDDDEIRRAARTLIVHNQDTILALQEQVEQAGQQLRGSVYEAVLTHGDLASENILVTGDGQLFIIDWGKLMRGPVERDLLEFRGEHFEEFVTHYLSHRKTKPDLCSDVFDYYLRWNCLAQITDYGSWILLEDAESSELLHPWERLQTLLLIRIDDIAAEFNFYPKHEIAL